MDKFKLEFVTPEKSLLSSEVEQVIIPGSEGAISAIQKEFDAYSDHGWTNTVCQSNSGMRGSRCISWIVLGRDLILLRNQPSMRVPDGVSQSPFYSLNNVFADQVFDFLSIIVNMIALVLGRVGQVQFP